MKNKTATTQKPQIRISRITIGRLYNLGNYEHIRYEVTVDIPEGESAEKAFRNVSQILKGANPKPPCQKYEYDRALDQINDPQTWMKNVEDPKERKRRIAEMIKDAKKLAGRWQDWVRQRNKAAALLDDIGATVVHKDAKEDWHDDDMEF